MKYLALALILCTATVVGATTWHVSQDGSGDFEIIQDAVDAAEPGDVIHIHAGRYLNVTYDWDLYGDNTVILDVHVVATKDNLTLQGDGPDVTIIGPESVPPGAVQNYMGISVCHNEASTLTIRDLAVEGVNYRVNVDSPYLNVTNCRFEGSGYGVWLQDAAGLTTISNCHFIGGKGVQGIYNSDNIEIYNCVFEGCGEAAIFNGNEGVVIDGCEFSGGQGGININQGSSCTIRNCAFRDVFSIAIYTSLGGYADIRRCTFDGSYQGVHIEGFGGSHIEECTFTGQLYAALYFNSNDPNTVTDCNIYNGGQWSVRCLGSGACYLDMRGNYWGTDDEDQIREWIYDSNDNPEYNCNVDFIPFSTVLSVEQKSWSAVKELFRE